jgi:probable HAF family extracellular repeat protein
MGVGIGPAVLMPIPIGGSSTDSIAYAIAATSSTAPLTAAGANNGQACLMSATSSTILCPGAAYGVNDTGAAVGQDSSTGQAFLYSGGAPSLIQPSPSTAYGINAAGQVVGAMPAAGSAGTNAFLFSSNPVSGASSGPGIGITVVLPGANASANAIDNSSFIQGGWNDVAGYANSSLGVSQACLWTSGSTVQNLGCLPALGTTPQGEFASSAQGIRSAPVLPLGAAISVTGANVVGWSNTLLGGNPHAFLWTSATESMYDLNHLIGNFGWTLTEATAINAKGWIVGNATNNATGLKEGFLLTPVPTTLFGDAVLNGTVDINDLTIVLANYGQTGMTWTQGEFTGSGTVDINDLTIVLANYNETVSATAGPLAVPEPSTLVLIGLAVVSFLACTYRRRR